MAKSVDTITKKRVARKPVKVAAKVAPPKKVVARPRPVAHVVVAPIPKPVPTPRRAPTPKSIVPPPASPVSYERRRKYMAPLVISSLAVILMLWAAFGAAMHPRQAGDTFFASFAKNFNVASIKSGWDRVLNRGTEEERAIRKAEQEIFPQFETVVNTN